MADEHNCQANPDQVNGNMSVNLKAAILLIIGEPFNAEYKDLIDKKLLQGLRSWDSEKCGCNIYTLLEAFVAAAPEPEQGNHGEVTYNHCTDEAKLSVVISPSLTTIESQLRALLQSGATHHYVLYSGHYMQGSGSWILQDALFAAEYFHRIIKEPGFADSLERLASVQEERNLYLYGCEGSGWSSVTKPGAKSCGSLKVTAIDNKEGDDGCEAQTFLSYISPNYTGKTTKELLPASEVVGNIRFSGPTMYLFPGGQGDCALFGIAGFNLLVNGGYTRRPCFWDFTRHLDRIDALMQTHIGADNVFGMSTFIERKAEENVAPEVGCVLMNAPAVANPTEEDAIDISNLSLSVSITNEANKMLRNMKSFKLSPTPCIGTGSASILQPMNLYHKVGHGTLDLYVLNPPAGGDKEMKEFFTQWKKDSPSFTSTKTMPTPNMMSICALLVWKPANEHEPITRILFPGTAPQQKVFEGLNKLKNCNIFQHTSCSVHSLAAPKPAAKKAPATARSAPSASAKAAAKPEASKPATTKSAKDEHNNLQRKAEKKPMSAAGTAKAKSAAAKKTAAPPKTATPTKPAAKTSKTATEKKKGPIVDKAAKATKTPPPSPQEKSTAEPPPPAAAPEAVQEEIKKLAATPAEAGPTDTTTPEQSIGNLIDTEASTLLDMSANSGTSAGFVDNLFLNDVTTEAQTTKAAGDELQAVHEPVVLSAPVEASLLDLGGSHGSAQQEQETDLLQMTSQDNSTTAPPSQPPSSGVDLLQGSDDFANANMMDSFIDPSAHQATSPSQPEASPLDEAPTGLPEPVQPAQDPMTMSQHFGFAAEAEGKENQMAPEDFGIYEAPESQPDLLQTHEQDSTKTSAMEDLGIYESEAQPAPDLLGAMEQSSAVDGVMSEEIQNGIHPVVDSSDIHLEAADPPIKASGLEAKQEPSEDLSNATLPTEATDQGTLFDGAAPEGLPDPPEHGTDLLADVASLEEVMPVKAEQTLPAPSTEVQTKEQGQEVPAQLAEEQVEEPQAAPMTEEEAQERNLSEQFNEKQIEGSTEKVTEKVSASAYEIEDTVKEEPALVAPFCVDQIEMQLQEEEEDKSVTAGDVTPPDSEHPHMLTADQLQKNLTDASDMSAADDSEAQKTTAGAEHSADEVENELELNGTENIPQAELTNLDTNSTGTNVEDSTTKDKSKANDEDQSTESLPNSELYAAAPVEENVCSKEEAVDPIVEEILKNKPEEDCVTPENVNFNLQDHIMSTVRHEHPDSNECIENHADVMSDSLVDDPSLKDFDEGNDPDKAVVVSNFPAVDGNINLDSSSNTNPFVGVSPADSDSNSQDETIPAQGAALTDTKESVPESQSNIGQPDAISEDGSFDPLKSWGQPMDLPAPPPPKADLNTSTASRSKTPAANKPNGTAPKAPASKPGGPSKPATRPASSPTKTTTMKKTTTTTTATRTVKKEVTNGPAAKVPASATKKARPASATKKARPSTAPADISISKAAPAKRAAPAAATATKTRSASGTRTASATPVVPFYVDLTYIPAHGDDMYTSVEFFKRVRARYYVLSALNPSLSVLNALLEGRQTWTGSDSEIEVTLIPTYDTLTLRRWMAENRDTLSELKLTIAPSASRCSIQLQDHEASCAAYRLEF